MAIKFAAKDPAKAEPAKGAKDLKDGEAKRPAVAAPAKPDPLTDEAVDLFEAEPKPTGRKKGK